MAKIKTINEKLLERYIRHAVYLEQFKKGEAMAISSFLKQETFPQLYKKLMVELGKVKDLSTVGFKIKRLKKMLAATHKVSVAGAVKAEKMLVKRLINISKFEAKWNADLIEKTVLLDIDRTATMPSNEVLKNLVTQRPFGGHKLSTWMNGYSKSVTMAMGKAVKVGVATGESLPAIAKRIERALGHKGKQAQYIARTAVSNVVHQAREEVFKKNTDIVRKVQWISTLDDRTSIECIHLDGQIFDVGTKTRPPIHFNCRSTVIPVTPSWQEYGVKDPPPATRASMNGAVPAKTTYKQWLKTRSKKTQINVLGKKRAELYDSGKGIKIDRFVGKDLKPLTLKQLAKREGLDLRTAPPSQVKAMSTKGTGVVLNAKEIKILDDWSFQGNHNMVNAQLGRSMDRGWILSNKQEAMKSVKGLEKALTKLDGFEGVAYRGLRFENELAMQKYLSGLKVGGVWKNKAFMSASTKRSVATKFSEGLTKSQRPVIIEIKGMSGRSITQFSPKPKEMEILFTKGTPFKIDKIVGNKVYLSEITKQAQLKATPVPPSVTATRVGTTFTGETTKEFKDIVNKQLNIYPEKVKVALNNNGTSYKFGEKTTQMLPELKGKQPQGWSAGSTWDSVEALYHIDSKSIIINETYYSQKLKAFATTSTNRIRGGLNHETGHAWNHSSITGMVYSNQHKFKAAYMKDIAKLSEADKLKNSFFLQWGELGRDETFAEIFANIIGEGSLKRDISKFFPECKKYIEDLLK